MIRGMVLVGGGVRQSPYDGDENLLHPLIFGIYIKGG